MTERHIHDFILQHFDKGSLRAFCQNYFFKVYEAMGPSHTFVQLLEDLMGYCEAQNNFRDLEVYLEKEKPVDFQIFKKSLIKSAKPAFPTRGPKKNDFDISFSMEEPHRGSGGEIDFEEPNAGDSFPDSEPPESMPPIISPSPAIPPAPNPSKRGEALYSIPSKMQHQVEHACLIRVAYDKATLRQDVPDWVANPVEKTNIRMSDNDLMEVAFEQTDHFEITPPDSLVQPVEIGFSTEWVFKVKPLHLGTYPLTFKLFSFIKSGDGFMRKEAVLIEKIEVVTYHVEEALEMKSAEFTESKETDMEKIKALVAKGNLGEAIEVFHNEANGESKTEATMLSARFAKNEKDNRMGLLTTSDYNLERNKITAALLDLLDKPMIVKPTASSPTPTPSTSSSKILFISASPYDQRMLQTEFDEITETLQPSLSTKEVELVLPIFKADYEKLLLALKAHKPQVLHYSGHGTPEGLCLINNEKNTTQLLENSDLEDIFDDRSGYLKLVFLNSCFSSNQAKIISEKGIIVLGINNQAIPNNVATALAEKFYLGFTAQEGEISIEKAVKIGCKNFVKNFPDQAGFISVWKNGMEVGFDEL